MLFDRSITDQDLAQGETEVVPGCILYEELGDTSLEVATPRASNSVVAASHSATGGVAGATGGREPMELSGSERRLSRERGGKEPIELSGSESRPSRARRLPKMRPKPPGRRIRRETPHAPPMRARAAALAPTAMAAVLTGESGGAHGGGGGGGGGELWSPGGKGDGNGGGGGDIGDSNGKAGGGEDGGESALAGDGGAVDVALPSCRLPIRDGRGCGPSCRLPIRDGRGCGGPSENEPALPPPLPLLPAGERARRKKRKLCRHEAPSISYVRTR